ncbi:MAG TPA: ribonuclease P protein component [Planctomycetaceae bacterium]
MTSPSPRYRLTKRQKLRRPAEFKRVYDAGAKAGDDRLLVFALPNGLGVTRLGLSVSRKHGSAVRRNRIKRLLREAFRLGQHDLPTGLDLVLVPRPDGGATLADFRRSLAGCVRRAVKRLPAAAEVGASDAGGQRREPRDATPAVGPPLPGERGQG